MMEADISWYLTMEAKAKKTNNNNREKHLENCLAMKKIIDGSLTRYDMRSKHEYH